MTERWHACVWRARGWFLVFWGKVIEQQVRMMAVDGVALSPRAWGDLLEYLFIEPGGLRRIARRYLAHYRPRFHPWNIDTGGLIEQWRARQEPRNEFETAS